MSSPEIIFKNGREVVASNRRSKGIVASYKEHNDNIQTPPALAKAIVEHFRPAGRVLEPCAGNGSFLAALPPGSDWCELSRGRDFMDYAGRADWIVTNPPYSKMRAFMVKAMSVSDNVVFLTSVNHFWLRARLRDITAAGFGIKEIVLVDTPSTFLPTGFQIGVVHLARGWAGLVALTDWRGRVFNA